MTDDGDRRAVDGGSSDVTEASYQRGHDELTALLPESRLPIAIEPDEASADAAVFDTESSASGAASEPGATFPQSVASGDPTPEGVILWTRIDPAAVADGEPLGVELATDEAFEDIVHRGTVAADHVTTHDTAVSIELDGLLDPDRFYHYRFTYDGVRSRPGRCHTLPEPDASLDRLRLAVLTCQDYQNGYYGAYHHIAREDVDFVIHVGDFVYDSAEGQYKGFGSHEYPDRDVTLPSGHDEAWTLDDYRHLYRLYKSDDCLQRAHERHTLIAARDDHEFSDNIHWDEATAAPKAPHHPRGDDPAFMRRLTADALQAWWEHMPARVRYDPDAEAFHERFGLWNRYEFGDLVELVMTDERLYRDEPLGSLPFRWSNPDREPPDHTMLGGHQREWLLDRLRNPTATWSVWSDEVLTVPFKMGAGRATVHPSQSGWDGYQRERRAIMRALEGSPTENFVTLTGDMHCYIAGYQQTEYRDALSYLRDGTTAADADADSRVGVEFMTPAMTSVNVAEGANVNSGRLGDLTERLLPRAVRAQNPHIEFFDSNHWGYSVVEFTPEDCTYTGYSVDKTEKPRETESGFVPGKETLVRLRVPEGRVEIEELDPPERP